MYIYEHSVAQLLLLLFIHIITFMNLNLNEIEKIVDNVKDLLLLNKEAKLDNISKWQMKNKFADQLLKDVSNAEFLQNKVEAYYKTSLSNKKAVNRLKSAIQMRNERSLRRILFAKIGTVAAAVMFLSVLVYLNSTDIEKDIITSSVNVNSIITDGPILLTGGGEVVDLNDVLTNDTIKVKDILLKNNKCSDCINKSELNTIVIPGEKTYHIILNDGTQVWLNANSKLSYPSNFTSSVRNVKLDGEAYFKVSKSLVPFVVDVNGNMVKVYGTDLVIKSRKGKISVILISGSVGVTPKGTDEIMLKPNQLGVINIKSGNCRVSEVDTRRYLAWKDGFFRLDNQPIGELVDDVCNWYGIKINNLDSINMERLTSLSLSRKMKVEDIISILQRILKKNIINEGGGVYEIE